MKKILSLIIAALAVVLVGCVTDLVPEEVNNSSDVTVLTLNIAKTKVALGEKDNSNNYPMYWSEGDKISVNGYISEEALINSEDKSSAQFQFVKTSLQYPYNILYPASADNTVVFAAQQNYVKGTFESGTTPMYATTQAGDALKLNHLSGVLRFNFKASNDDTTLSKVVVKAGEGVIAGEFALDFATGTLTPAEGATSTLEYSFGEGLKLSTTDAESFYVVLPKGSYGLCSVTLHATDGGMMSARFNTAGTSGIKPGVVRNFGTATYKRGTVCTLTPLEIEDDELVVDSSSYMKVPAIDGDYLVINDARQLVWLCHNKPELNGKQYSKIKVGRDIDMEALSLLELPAMKLYAGTEVDGNNKTITGVNMGADASSIFGDANNLNIHDLTLTDCSVESNLQTGAAILVGMASEGLTVSNVTFHNCSVVAPRKIGLVAGALHSGTFNISGVTANGGVVATSYVSGKSGLAGGLVGCFAKNGDGATTSTATFTNCTTSTTVQSYMEANNYFYGKMVGQLGGYNGDEKLYFVNCDGRNAQLVALYDQGAKHAEKALLTYCDAHRADFCQTALSADSDNLLGGERYCRGEVYYEGNRFYAKWDGIRSVSMITESVDGVTRYLVQSPYDLASAQAQKYAITKALVFKTNVDMGGHLFTPIEYVINLDGENHELHNLKVVGTHFSHSSHGQMGVAFINYANSWSVHKDLTFVGADITCNHDATVPAPAYGDTNDGIAGNAYAGVLVSRSWRSADSSAANGYSDYHVSNVHVKSSKVRGVCKVGGLIGACRGQVYIDNCSVDNSTIENYDPKIANYYTMVKSISKSILVFSIDVVVEGLQWWYTAGECGGLIGFLEAHYAEITNCSVTNTAINCTGQPNKDVVANVWDKSKYVEGAYTNGGSLYTRAVTTIAGRHVNQFIGDIRSRRTETQSNNGTGEYTNKILNYTVSGNTYNGVAADSANEYNHNYASGKYCPVVGCAYYTGVDISFAGVYDDHVSECAGTLVFSEKGGAETTLTEAVGNGNNMDWFGGNGSTSSGTSYYPEAPTE